MDNMDSKLLNNLFFETFGPWLNDKQLFSYQFRLEFSWCFRSLILRHLHVGLSRAMVCRALSECLQSMVLKGMCQLSLLTSNKSHHFFHNWIIEEEHDISGDRWMISNFGYYLTTLLLPTLGVNRKHSEKRSVRFKSLPSLFQDLHLS